MVIDALCVLGLDREYNLDSSTLLKDMELNCVDRAIISPVDRFLAVNNQEGNDFILNAAERHPDRLIPACSANPWYGSMAVKEIRRAIEAGARMLILHPFVQGYLANDELVWPLVDEAGMQKVPVYIHTGPPGNATPWQITDLAERYPEVDFLMGHCGSTDFWNDANDAALSADNIFLETSLARPFYIPGRLQALGNRRVIMGSYAPLNDFSVEWEETRKVLSPQDAIHVLGDNLRRLLEKKEVL